MKNQQGFTLQRHSGLTRAYFKPVYWQLLLPDVSDIIEDSNDYVDLMYHIALNHKGLNWKIYKFQLSPHNYQVFIYSIAFCMMNTKSCYGYLWQLDRNARKIMNFVNKNNIHLQRAEESILNLGSNFSMNKCPDDVKKSEISQLINELQDIYEA